MVRLELLLTAGRLLMYSSLGEEGEGEGRTGTADFGRGKWWRGAPSCLHCPNPETRWNDGRVRSHVLISRLARFLLSQDGKADLVT